MENELSEVAKELGTYPIVLDFTDDAGDPVTPNTATWTLTDLDGNVINARLDVTISGLAPSVTVVLTGDDLQMTTGAEDEVRVLTVEGDYDSTLGNNLPLTDQVKFTIENLIGSS